jgi:hypothetical protein
VSQAQARFAHGENILTRGNEVDAFAPGDADVAFDKFKGIVADCSSFEVDGRTFEIWQVNSPSRATNRSRSPSLGRSRGSRSASTSSSSGSQTA